MDCRAAAIYAMHMDSKMFSLAHAIKRNGRFTDMLAASGNNRTFSRDATAVISRSSRNSGQLTGVLCMTPYAPSSIVELNTDAKSMRILNGFIGCYPRRQA